MTLLTTKKSKAKQSEETKEESASKEKGFLARDYWFSFFSLQSVGYALGHYHRRNTVHTNKNVGLTLTNTDTKRRGVSTTLTYS